MTAELTALVLATLWQVVHLALYSVFAQLQVGTQYAASPRDKPRQLAGTAGRLQRAMTNHFEGLILFSIAALTITYVNKTSPLTAVCAYTYLAARVAYLPAYVFGWTPTRSLIWLIGFLATVALLILTLL